jgi:hypothetical protein
MKQTYWLWIILPLIVLVGTSSLTGCGVVRELSEPIYPIVHTRELLLDAQPLPPGWQAIPCEPACARAERPAESMRTIGRPGIPGKVLHIVYAFRSNTAARDYFARVRDADFQPRAAPDVTLTPHPTVPMTSLRADESMIGCGRVGASICFAVLRYRNYVVTIYIDIDAGYGDGLQPADVPPILAAMDQRVVDVFSLPAVTPGP